MDGPYGHFGEVMIARSRGFQSCSKFNPLNHTHTFHVPSPVVISQQQSKSHLGTYTLYAPSKIPSITHLNFFQQYQSKSKFTSNHLKRIIYLFL